MKISGARFFSIRKSAATSISFRVSRRNSSDVIAAGGEAAIRAAQQATNSIPIVMQLAADPVGSGFIESLNHPGGNFTVMSVLASDMASKRVELVRDVVQSASRVAVLWNSTNRSKNVEWNDTKIAATTTGLTLYSVEARTGGDLDDAFGTISRERVDAIIVFTDSLTLGFRVMVAADRCDHQDRVGLLRVEHPMRHI